MKERILNLMKDIHEAKELMEINDLLGLVTTAEYKELQSSPLAAAKRGYVDTIIMPEDTRKYIIGAFEMGDRRCIMVYVIPHFAAAVCTVQQITEHISFTIFGFR